MNFFSPASNRTDDLQLTSNNYAFKWRWLVVHVYQATKQQVKYPPLATYTENIAQKDDMNLFTSIFGPKSCMSSLEVNSRGYLEFAP